MGFLLVKCYFCNLNYDKKTLVKKDKVELSRTTNIGKEFKVGNSFYHIYSDEVPEVSSGRVFR